MKKSVVITVAFLVIIIGVFFLINFRFFDSEENFYDKDTKTHSELTQEVNTTNTEASTENNQPEKDSEVLDEAETIVAKEKTQDNPPVLKNLGVNIEPWNKQTNLAGDIIFNKKLIYDDGRVAGDKVFIDFGHADKYRTENKYAIEYWFFVPSGTNVYAPVDGRVEIGFFNHTQDWGISFYSEEWKSWIVSFEHVVNLNVKEGDIVKAGDIVAKAAPRIDKDIAMVELAVWRPTRDHIYKFCPFEFLDESLKLTYGEKINQLAKDWEEFIGKDVYEEEKWVAPGCLLHNITER